MLKRMTPQEIQQQRHDPVDDDAIRIVQPIVEDVRARGEAALREHATMLGDLLPGAPLFIPKEALHEALATITDEERSLLERAASRIQRFAEMQRESLSATSMAIPGGRAGQLIAPLEHAGCYAPGGRFPLPSTVLMTAVTARVAGVREVWVASPKPPAITLAAAAIADADGVLACGGAQAIAAMAFGAGKIPACDMIVGPGNRYVTAAKYLVSRHVGIDMLAGPSELLVIADASADARVIAWDLLAQAEHDPDARPMLISLHADLLDAVDAEIANALPTLATRATAERALENGFALHARSQDEAIAICDDLAPEHVELHIKDAESVAGKLNHFGALFTGAHAAEALGDYGAGPNHTLPTGGTARFSGGLSVHHFLRIRTWMELRDAAEAEELIRDAERFGEIEGLAAHAASAAARATKHSE